MKTRTKQVTSEKPSLKLVSNKPSKGSHGGFRPGAGRPPSNSPKVQKKALYFSVTDSEKDRFMAEAENAGMSLSRYLRQLLELPNED